MNDLTPSPLTALRAESVSQQLADHVVSTVYSAIPPTAIEAAKLFMLDTLAVSWAGSDAPGCREAHGLLVEEGGRAESTAWVYGGRLPAASAAFINGMSSGALDFDALGREASVHVNITVLPAALALAEGGRTSGRDFLAALVIGSDVMYRLGAASRHPHQGFSYTSVFGVFGAAAAAARLLRLDPEKTRHAFGIAFLQAGGTQQANIEPSLSKRMLSAFAARAGVFAALLARSGITAPKKVFEGKFGIYRLYQDGDRDRLLDGLGSRFDNVELMLKKYPSCGCNHTAIEATLRLVRQHDLHPDDVRAVEVTVPPYVDRIVGHPYDPGDDAQVAAQFSIRYSIACVLVRRRLGLAEIQEAAARDPEIAQHIGKVSVRVDHSLKSERGPVVVRMSTSKHGEVSCRVEDVPGSPAAPLSQDETDDKLRECFRLGAHPLSERQVVALRERVRGLEDVPDMSVFFEGIC